MELWVTITVAAAFVQNLRTTLQKHLRNVMGTAGATFVRFGFGFPFAVVFVLLISAAGDMPVPPPNAAFLFWIVVAGLSQIIAQALLIQNSSEIWKCSNGNRSSIHVPVETRQ